MYLPETLLQLRDLTKEQIANSFEKQTDIVVLVERWNKKDKELEVRVGDFVGIIPQEEITIYSNSDSSILSMKLNQLIGKKVACKIIKADFIRNTLILSRKKCMEEAKKYYMENSYVEKAYVLKTIGQTAFLDIGYGVTGKINYYDFTNCRYVSVDDAGCSEGKIFPMKIIGITEKQMIFKLSYKEVTYPEDIKKISKIQPGDMLSCRVGKELIDETGFFIECLPNFAGIVDTVEYDYLSDKYVKVASLEVGQKINVIIKKIVEDKRGRTSIRARFVSYCD